MVIYAKEPVFTPESAAGEFWLSTRELRTAGILRAVTLRVYPRPVPESFAPLEKLASENGFSVRMGEDLEEYTVVTFLNQQPPA